MKKLITIVLSLLLLSSLFAQSQPLTPEQKVYELSVFWKEITYNFANKDHCPEVDLDSLYQAYIPQVMRTRNNFEHYLTMQRFAASFHNSHTYCMLPQNLIPELAMVRLITEVRDGRIFVKNISSRYEKEIQPGDEILQVDGMPALAYFRDYVGQYVSCSNPEAVLDYAMFTPQGLSPLVFQHRDNLKPLTLQVLSGDRKKTVKVHYDWFFAPTEQQRKSQERYHWVDTTQVLTNEQNNLIIMDEENDAVYLRIDDCNEATAQVFTEHLPEILKHSALIIDLRYNTGGDGRAYSPIVPHLIDNDMVVLSGKMQTPIHNATYMARASVRLLYYSPDQVSEQEKAFYYPYYSHTAFETISPDTVANTVPVGERFHGRIYLLIGSKTASAAEGFAAMLTQNPQTVTVGKKSSGATGQPLLMPLPSGIVCFINTFKTYDFNDRDYSSGIVPDVEMELGDVPVCEVIRKVITKMQER